AADGATARGGERGDPIGRPGPARGAVPLPVRRERPPPSRRGPRQGRAPPAFRLLTHPGGRLGPCPPWSRSTAARPSPTASASWPSPTACWNHGGPATP